MPEHTFDGFCPDSEQPDARDIRCEACRASMGLDQRTRDDKRLDRAAVIVAEMRDPRDSAKVKARLAFDLLDALEAEQERREKGGEGGRPC